jgi:hypothetical protein
VVLALAGAVVAVALSAAPFREVAAFAGTLKRYLAQ